ncbi:MAG: hypothetical protein HOW73_40870 [Polyangiaceae bacterium]|nr:hypothetical protein [Polyangiaceae bacterium]
MKRASRALAALLVSSSLAYGVASRAEPVDPAFPTVVTVGAPDTPASVDRLVRNRTSRSTASLPSQFVEAERHNLGAIGHPPVVHPDGTLTIALTSPELVRVGADGKELARIQLGSAAAVRSPVVLPNGSLAVLTGAPSVVFVSTTNKVTATIALPRASFGATSPSSGFTEGIASIVPTEDGAVAVASNRSLLEVDASSRVRMKVTLPERLASDVLPHDGGYLVAGESGTVFRVKPPAEPRKIGTFGSLIGGTVALVDDRTVVGQASPNRLVALDLKSGTAVTRVGDSIFAFFDAPAAYGAAGETWLTTGEGFLVGYDATGAEIARTPADRSAALPGGGPMFPPSRQPMPMPMPNGSARVAPVVDGAGRVAFARQNGRFGVRDEQGKVNATDRGCSAPIAIVPVADGKVVLACRDGTLVTYQEAKPAEKAAP